MGNRTNCWGNHLVVIWFRVQFVRIMYCKKGNNAGYLHGFLILEICQSFCAVRGVWNRWTVGGIPDSPSARNTKQAGC